MVVNTGDNRWATSNFIVAPTLAEGASYTTIAAALTAASSGNTIFIKPGTYTENLTLKAGVNLTAYVADSSLNGTGKVIISGTCTLTAAGSVSISGIQLQTNSAALLAVTGSAASIVNLNACYLNITNNDGITFSTSSASGAINIYNSAGNLGTTGIKIFAHSSAGTLLFNNSTFTNSGASSTASTASAGSLFTRYAIFQSPITTSGTNTGIFEWSAIDTNALNATSLTYGGSGGGISFHNFYSSGTASAISIGGDLTMDLDVVSSTNTNAITGAGTIRYSGISFPSTSSTINTTTQSRAGTLKGSTTTAPTAGMLGERLAATLGSGTPTALTTATAKTITSVSLTPGVWDIIGSVAFIPTVSASITQQIGSISATTNTLGATNSYDVIIWNYQVAITGISATIVTPPVRVIIAATTTYYLVGQSTFTVSTQTAYGSIIATRVG